METIEEKSRRSERRKIATEVEKMPIGKYSVPSAASAFEIAFTVRKEIAELIKGGGNTLRFPSATPPEAA